MHVVISSEPCTCASCPVCAVTDITEMSSTLTLTKELNEWIK